MKMTMNNSDVKLVKRYFFFPKKLFGVEKRGWQSVYKIFKKDYSNYDCADYECWYDYCWKEQVERLI